MRATAVGPADVAADACICVLWPLALGLPIMKQYNNDARAGKSHAELAEMEEGIQAQLEGGDAADPEFLAAVLKRLTLAKAKARLREIHESLLRKHLDRIVAAPDNGEDIAAAMGWADEENVSFQSPNLCFTWFY